MFKDNPYAAFDDDDNLWGDDAPVQMDLYALLFSFDGRANRAQYWGVSIGMFLVQLVVFLLAALAFGEDGFLLSIILVAIPSIWISLAIEIKRWHDLGKSGFFWFIGIIPYIGPLIKFIWCGFVEGDHGSNMYGPPTA